MNQEQRNTAANSLEELARIAATSDDKREWQRAARELELIATSDEKGEWRRAANERQHFMAITDELRRYDIDDSDSAINRARQLSLEGDDFYNPDWRTSRELWCDGLTLGFRLGVAFLDRKGKEVPF